MISEFDRARVIVLLLLSGGMVVVATAGWIAHRRQPTATLIVVLLFVASLLISLGVLMIRYSEAEAKNKSLVLIEVHGPTGHKIYVNPLGITSIREPADASPGHFASGTKCVLIMASGRFIAVSDTCTQVLRVLALTPLG